MILSNKPYQNALKSIVFRYSRMYKINKTNFKTKIFHLKNV